MSEGPERKKIRPQWVVRSVLDECLSREPQLVEAVVVTIEDKRMLTRCIEEISKIHPIPQFGHLKRIRGNDVILGSILPNDATYLDGLSVALVGKFKQIRRESVPRDAPMLRWQFEMASKYWPCKFHPDKQLESLYSNKIFSNHQVNFHIATMEMCLKLSDKHTNPAIVVDPRDGKIVTVAWSQVHMHPLAHTPMVAIDNVARSQDGGAWECENVTEVLETVQHELGQLPYDGESCGNLTKYGPYLCTGYDVYVLQEPCVMCAMALVHSRIRRIFFHQQTPQGALMSIVQLQTVRELNHHYQVFRIDS
uniref:Putative subunit of trna-specific adenosine-34 deaminase n=1 Tax=Nyssomyia neivai TaxID=330878 RepID=A0A1L8DGD4_9DIPT